MMWTSSVVLSTLTLLVTYSSASAVRPFVVTRVDNDSYRLPNNTRPVTYDIHVTTKVHRGDTKFQGVVIIDLEPVQSTSAIVLHAGDITITNSILALGEDLSHEYTHVSSHDKIKQFFTIETREILLARTLLRLTLHYEGNLRSEFSGFFIRSYRNSLGQDVFFAATQFEPIYARHAFPCYDEPNRKAVFRIKITHGKTHSALSNMPVISRTDNGDESVTTAFEQSVLTQTYLIAWAVSDFTYTEKLDRIPHRVYSQPNTDNLRGFALNASVAILNKLIDYLDIDYPLAKMDNLAIPSAPGAMENWGMVVYGENLLLNNAAETPTVNVTRKIRIMAHEFTHHWFGNLVGPMWWTYSWLKEGFPSLFEFKITNMVYPEWDIMQLWTIGPFRDSLVADARENPRPMTHYVDTPAEIASVFDYVAYGKSACVLRMIQEAFTESTFRKALGYYLKELKFGSAVEEDFFAAVKRAVVEDQIFPDLDFDALFKTWTHQGGFPLLTVTRDYNQGDFTIAQQPYHDTNTSFPTDRRTWWIPFNFVTSINADFNDTRMYAWIMPGVPATTVSQTVGTRWTNDDFILFNKQQTGYYRVNYDSRNWGLIAKVLQDSFRKIPSSNRAGLLDDAIQFVATGRLGYDTLFNLMQYMKQEDQYAPWNIVTNFVLDIDNKLTGDIYHRTFRFFYKKLVEASFKRLGVDEMETDTQMDRILRDFIISLACRANIAECLEATNRKLKNVLQKGEMIEPNLRGSILCSGMMQATMLETDLILRALKWTEDTVLRSQMIKGLACIRSTAPLKTYMQVTLETSNNISLTERLDIMRSVMETGNAGIKASIEFLLKNHQDYLKLSSNTSVINPVLLTLRHLSNLIYTTEQSKSFETLLDSVKNDDGMTAENFESLRSTVRNNLVWTTNNRKTIIDWTTQFYKENGGVKEEGELDGDGNGATTIVLSSGILSLVSIFILKTIL